MNQSRWAQETGNPDGVAYEAWLATQQTSPLLLPRFPSDQPYTNREAIDIYHWNPEWLQERAQTATALRQQHRYRESDALRVECARYGQAMLNYPTKTIVIPQCLVS